MFVKDNNKELVSSESITQFDKDFSSIDVPQDRVSHRSICE